MTFPLCLNTSTIQPTPLLEKVRLAREAGFDAIELWIDDIYGYIGQGGEARDVEKALADSGLTLPAMIGLRTWGDAVEDEYPRVLEEAKRRLDLTARLGAPYLLVSSPRDACELSLLSRRYADLLEIGRKVGVKPTFEFISFFRSVTNLAQAWEVVRGTNDPDATVLIDAFHNWNSGSTLDDLRRIPLERISHYHIDDAHERNPRGNVLDPARVLPGEGAIDLAGELAVLREKGYQGTVSLELFNRELWARDPREVLQEAMGSLRRVVG